jgi:DNA-binding MarR family transcriptional regulator
MMDTDVGATKGSVAMATPEQRRAALSRDAYIALQLLGSRFAADIDRCCREEGISENHFRVLWVLCLSEGDQAVPSGSIADGLLTRSSDVTRLVDRLVERGDVDRHPSLDDRRVVLVHATAKGRMVFERINTAVQTIHAEHWASFDDDQLQHLLILLNRALWNGALPGDLATAHKE